MKKDLNMDKAIRKKLESFSVDPPTHVWNNIQEEMAGKRRKKHIAYIGWVAAAAVVVFAFIAGWMLNEQSTPINKTLVEKQVGQPLEREKNIVFKEQPETQSAAVEVQTPTVPEEHQTNVLAQFIKKEDFNDEAASESEVLERNTDYKMLAPKTTVVFDKEIIGLSEKRTTKVEPSNTLSENDRLLIAENIRQNYSNKEDETGWIVGAHVSPGYSAHRSSYSDRFSRDMNQVSDGGVSNVGGGLSIQYKSNKRLSIESGVYYAQNSQSDGGRGSDMLFAAAPSIGYAAYQITDENNLYTNTVRVSPRGIEMNSTAGVVILKDLPEGAELSTLSDARKNAYNTTLLVDGEFSEKFDFIEVPLYLRYKVLDKKIGIDVLGGINAGFVVGNNAYVKNEYGKQNVGETADISTLNFSGTIGFGVNYGLGKHFSLALEPRLNYYLNSINSSSELDYKPYRIALFTGIYYEF